MNHGRNVDRKGIKTKLIVFNLIIFFSFSIFSNQLVITNQSSYYQIDTATSFPDSSKIAYTETYIKGGYFFVIF